MRVTILKSHRLATIKDNGDPGYRDLAEGEVVEIPDAAFDPALHAPGVHEAVTLEEQSAVSEKPAEAGS
jgi:hypothetical protein